MSSRPWPRFIFKIYRMTSEPEPPGETLETWDPPMCPEHETNPKAPRNVKPNKIPTVFYCDGESIYIPPVRLENERQSEHFKTVSAFNCAGVPKIVDYDATEEYVGSARPQTSMEGTSNQEQLQGEDKYMAWSTIRFQHCDTTGTSYACYAEEHARPLPHRENATWPYYLLPESCRSEGTTSDPDRGGMNIVLEVLIVLLAFSVPEGDMRNYLQNCLRNGRYNAPLRQSVRAGRYGIVVEVFTWPKVTYRKDLEEFGQGTSEKYPSPLFRD